MADNKDDAMAYDFAARAATQGTDQLGFNPGTRPSLGDVNVVSDLVADFCAEIVEIRVKYLRDELEPEQAKLQVRRAALEYGRIIMGENPHYEAQEWHSPRRLGVRIQKVVPPVKGIEHPGTQLFMTLAGSLSSLSVVLTEGRMSDADAKAHLVSLQKQANELILGWPNAGAK
ncbi:hypothetical protein CTA21_16295 [Salmonella enterica]|nr:hypothetical protein [Salmonella enterica]